MAGFNIPGPSIIPAGFGGAIAAGAANQFQADTAYKQNELMLRERQLNQQSEGQQQEQAWRNAQNALAMQQQRWKQEYEAGMLKYHNDYLSVQQQETAAKLAEQQAQNQWTQQHQLQDLEFRKLQAAQLGTYRENQLAMEQDKLMQAKKLAQQRQTQPLVTHPMSNGQVQLIDPNNGNLTTLGTVDPRLEKEQRRKNLHEIAANTRELLKGMMPNEEGRDALVRKLSDINWQLEQLNQPDLPGGPLTFNSIPQGNSSEAGFYTAPSLNAGGMNANSFSGVGSGTGGWKLIDIR